jgi:hypothetical protein
MIYENECTLMGYSCTHKAVSNECQKYCTCGLMCSQHIAAIEPQKTFKAIPIDKLIDEIVMKCFTTHTFHTAKLSRFDDKVLALRCSCATELIATKNMLLSENIKLDL